MCTQRYVKPFPRGLYRARIGHEGDAEDGGDPARARRAGLPHGHSEAFGPISDYTLSIMLDRYRRNTPRASIGRIMIWNICLVLRPFLFQGHRRPTRRSGECSRRRRKSSIRSSASTGTCRGSRPDEVEMGCVVVGRGAMYIYVYLHTQRYACVAPASLGGIRLNLYLYHLLAITLARYTHVYI